MYLVKIDDNKDYQVETSGGELQINGKQATLEFEKIKENEYRVFSNNQVHRVEIIEVDRASKVVQMKVNGKGTTAQLKNNLDQLLEKLGIDQGSSAGMKDLKAPMPGMVLKINVTPGQEIKKGEPLVILEAMKMENVIKAQGDGTVKSVLVEEKQTVDKNQVILEF